MPYNPDKEYAENSSAYCHDNQGEYPQGQDMYLVRIVAENIEHCKEENDLRQGNHITHNQQYASRFHPTAI